MKKSRKINRRRMIARKIIKSSRDRGAWVEMCFAMRAMREGLRPAKPWGEPPGYDAFHFLAALVIPEATWCIIPEELVWGLSTLGFNPRLDTEKYHPFKEAWFLLRGLTPGVIPRIDACAEEYVAESPEEW